MRFVADECCDAGLVYLRRPAVPEYQEARAGDVMHSLAEISRARRFGCTPRLSLEEGPGETAQGIQTCHSEDLP